jgi:hypothetical protein
MGMMNIRPVNATWFGPDLWPSHALQRTAFIRPAINRHLVGPPVETRLSV